MSAGRVGIAACGVAPFTREARDMVPLMLESVAALFEGGAADRGAVDAVLVSTNDGSKYLAPILSEAAGIRPGAAHTVENMCSSGATAVISGYSYIAAGLADVVLVCGADRHDGPGQVLDWDVSRGGFRRPVYWASILASAYKRRYGVSEEQLAAIPAKNRRNARDNPNALAGGACGIRDVLGSRKITDDIRLLECSRPCTGSASVLLASEEAAAGMGCDPVWITGVGHGTERASFAAGRSFSSLESAKTAAGAALHMAGRAPGDVDVAEVHDAFGVCEPMALESIGICGPGRGAQAALDMYETGGRMANPRGGLIGAGHPLGATGVAQAAEIVEQLCGRAGRRQVDGARCGLVHNMSAGGTSSSVLVMER